MFQIEPFSAESKPILFQYAIEKIARGILPDESKENYQAPSFRGNALAIQSIRASAEFIIAGPYECLAGETKIYDPLTGTETEIKFLAEAGKPITILTMRGPQRIEAPFLKGRKKLYRVTMESGKSFVATAKHRVLTSRGWTCVGDLQIGQSLPSSSPCLRLSSSGNARSIRPEGDPRSSGRSQDFPASCSAYFYQCDEQPLLDQDTDQVFAPLQVGVPERSHVGRSSDDLGVLSKYSRRNRLSDRLAISRYSQEFSEKASTPNYFLEQSLSLCGESFRFAFLYPEALLLASPVPGQDPRFDHKLQPFSSLSPNNNKYSSYYTIHTDTVSNIKFERTDYFYDMHVPGVQHYFAEGFWHHNTGKTFAALWLLDSLLREHPGARAAIIRKVRTDMDGTCLETWRNVISIRGQVEPYGGERPQWYDYNNGSRVYIGGLDNPGKTLSGERDFIYVNQAEELSRDDWETLSTRATGRAAHAIGADGVPIAILFGDCNPGPPHHWILKRPQLKVLPSSHKDNPTLYDDDGNLTGRGAQTMEKLEGLTGHRRLRGKEGKWSAADNVVYEPYDPLLHLIDRFDVPREWPKIAGVDFGFTNPGSVGIHAYDNDDRAYRIHGVYQTRKDFDQWWLPKMIDLQALYAVEVWYCDPSEPAYIQKMRDAGLNAVPADNSVEVGLSAVRSRLKPEAEGRKPRLLIFRDELEERDPSRDEHQEPCGFAEEILGYVNKKDGQGNILEEPVKKNDHAMDECRYAIYSREAGRGPKLAADHSHQSAGLYA